MDGLAYYRRVREELIDLYQLITTRHFNIVAKRSLFFSTEQLERLANNPPPGGLGRLDTQVEFSVTIERLVLGFRINGNDMSLGFSKPKRDIPIIYESVQEYIRLWVDIKMNSYGYKTASLKELHELEGLARFLFDAYKYYYEEERRKEMNSGNNITEYGLANALLGKLVYGMGGGEISFESYLDRYNDQISAKAGMNTFYATDKYETPVRQKGLTDMFDEGNMKHGLGEWV